MVDLSASLLAEAGRSIEERSGLAFPPEKWPELRRGLEMASETLGLSGARELAEKLPSPSVPGEWMTVLLNHLTVGETYFFREPETLEALENYLLPEFLEERRSGSRTLRIWSAGCATGEEPYTLAMLLCRAIPDIDHWNVSVLATDINTASLRKAKVGIYTAWSFRGTPEWVKNGFFLHSGKHGYSVSPRIRKMVRFERLNLRTDIFPASPDGTAGVDLIFCRNVLMYFSPECIEAVLERFFDALAPGGYLVVSVNELSVGRFEGFERVVNGNVFCYRKPSGTRNPYAWLPAAARKIPAQRKSDPASVGRSPRRGRTAPGRSRAAVPPAASSPPLAEGEPRNPEPSDLLEAARRCADSGRLEEALGHCEASLNEHAMDPAAHYLYAAILQETGNAKKAVQELKRVIYLAPEFVTAYISLGHILQTSGNRQEADRQLSNALSILERYQPGDVVPESGGTTAGALAAMIRAIGTSEDVADGGGDL